MTSRRTALKAVAIFIFMWGCIGYAMGTATLLGPVRWVTDRLRAGDAGEGTERLAVLAIIVALVVVSGLVAALCTRRVLRASTPPVRLGVPALALVAALLCVWVWMTPSLMRGSGEEVTIASVEWPEAPRPAALPVESDSARPDPGPAPRPESSPQPERPPRPKPDAGARTHFTFGPYPEADRLAELKDEGFDGVISLLHPAVVPFEPKLLAREEKAAAAVGIELFHLPMLPWVGDNEASLDRLRQLASSPGRYYVHCYLGRDRVRLAQAVVARTLEGRDGVTFADGMQARKSLAEKASFERGPIVQLAEDAFLTPYPTDEEFASQVVSESWGSIVTLLDPEVAENRSWIEKERAILERYGMELIEMPISLAGYDAAATLERIEAIRALPRPLLVHDFLAVSSGKAPAAEAFLAGWSSGLPPLAASLFSNESTQVLAANLVVGPRPDFSRVARKGIERVLFVGPGEPVDDRRRANAAGMGFAQVDPALQPEWADRLLQDGPWYVYGVEPEIVGERLAAGGDA